MPGDVDRYVRRDRETYVRYSLGTYTLDRRITARRTYVSYVRRRANRKKIRMSTVHSHALDHPAKSKIIANDRITFLCSFPGYVLCSFFIPCFCFDTLVGIFVDVLGNISCVFFFVGFWLPCLLAHMTLFSMVGGLMIMLVMLGNYEVASSPVGSIVDESPSGPGLKRSVDFVWCGCFVNSTSVLNQHPGAYTIPTLYTFLFYMYTLAFCMATGYGPADVYINELYNHWKDWINGWRFYCVASFLCRFQRFQIDRGYTDWINPLRCGGTLSSASFFLQDFRSSSYNY